MTRLNLKGIQAKLPLRTIYPYSSVLYCCFFKNYGLSKKSGFYWSKTPSNWRQLSQIIYFNDFKNCVYHLLKIVNHNFTIVLFSSTLFHRFVGTFPLFLFNLFFTLGEKGITMVFVIETIYHTTIK